MEPVGVHVQLVLQQWDAWRNVAWTLYLLEQWNVTAERSSQYQSS